MPLNAPSPQKKKILVPPLPGRKTLERFSRAGPRGRGREWATLGVHPLSWLRSNNRLEELCGTLTTGTFSSRLLLSNQDKGCTPSVAHSLPLPLGPALLNLWTIFYLQMPQFSSPITALVLVFAPDWQRQHLSLNSNVFKDLQSQINQPLSL